MCAQQTLPKLKKKQGSQQSYLVPANTSAETPAPLEGNLCRFIGRSYGDPSVQAVTKVPQLLSTEVFWVWGFSHYVGGTARCLSRPANQVSSFRGLLAPAGSRLRWPLSRHLLAPGPLPLCLHFPSTTA